MSQNVNGSQGESDAGSRAYWRATLRLTAALLLVWAGASFLPGWFADELNSVVFFGWPLGFYMAGQGSLIIFICIVWLYDRGMVRVGQRCGVEDGG